MGKAKRNIAIIAGGNSSEYEISIESASNILNSINKKNFNPHIVEIKREGWKVWGPDGLKQDIDKHDFSTRLNGSKHSFDGVINAIHGTPGENGIIQAYFDLIGLPITGCDSFYSSLTFNKYACNTFLTQQGLPVAPSLLMRKGDTIELGEIHEKVGYPCFIKPNSGGSSCGTSRVEKPEEVENALVKAFKEDAEVLIEKFIPGRELTCGMLITKKDRHVFPITEIISRKEFFDYEAKYTAGVASEITPADIPEKTARSVMDLSINLSGLLNCRGLVRFDYILNEQTPWFLEVNTVPGMSSKSIVPQQAEAYGFSLSDLYDLLLEDILPA